MGSCQLWTLAFFYLTVVLCQQTKCVTLEMPHFVWPGETVTVMCLGSDLRNVSIYKDDRIMQSDSVHQITWTVSEVKLNITALSETDEGNYSCVSNGNIKHQQKIMTIQSGRRRIPLTTSSSTISEQGSVTLDCPVDYFQNPQWLRRRSAADSHFEILKEFSNRITVYRGGVYSCRGASESTITVESNTVTITQTGVTLEMPSSDVFLGDSVTVRCVGSDVSNVNIYKDGTMVQSDSVHQINRTFSEVELKISPVSATDQGDYSCVSNGNRKHNQRTLKLMNRRRSISLTISSKAISDKGDVLLYCSVEGFPIPQWFRHRSVGDFDFERLNKYWTNIRVYREGVYSCRGVHEVIITEESKEVTIIKYGATLEMPSDIYVGDSVTVRCVGPNMENIDLLIGGKMVQEDSSHQIIRTDTSVELRISPVQFFDVYTYSCVSKGNIVHSQRSPLLHSWENGAYLETSGKIIPDQGNVTLECHAWSYENRQWLRRSSDSNSTSEILKENSSSVTVSRGGVYSCRGTGVLVLSKESNTITVLETGLPLQMPSWAYPGDTVTVQCVGPATKELHFYKDGVIVEHDTNHRFKRTSDTTAELIIHRVSASDGGTYSCGVDKRTVYTGQQLQIRPEKKSSTVFVLVLVGGLVLLLILLLIFFKNTKDMCLKRSQETNQTSAEDHVTTASAPDDVDADKPLQKL